MEGATGICTRNGLVSIFFESKHVRLYTEQGDLLQVYHLSDRPCEICMKKTHIYVQMITDRRFPINLVEKKLARGHENTLKLPNCQDITLEIRQDLFGFSSYFLFGRL